MMKDPDIASRTAPARLDGPGWRFGEFRIPAGLDLLYRGEEIVALEPLAVRVLRHLVRHAGRVWARRSSSTRCGPAPTSPRGCSIAPAKQPTKYYREPPNVSLYPTSFGQTRSNPSNVKKISSNTIISTQSVIGLGQSMATWNVTPPSCGAILHTVNRAFPINR